MGNKALQSLALQYIRGEISRPEYLQQRKHIIDEATGYIESESPLENEQPATDNRQTNPLLRAGLISAIVVVALLVFYSTL